MVRRTVTRGLGLAAAALLAVVVPAPSAPAITPVSCPSFTVLHNDSIGPAVLPSGTYTVSLGATSGLSCASASRLFARFLADYDGVLPPPWRVVAEGSGKASFTRGGKAGFSVARGSGGGGGDTGLGRLCAGSFTVEADATVGPLSFPRGKYLLYLPPRSGIACNRASVLFTRFLGAPGARLPFPWRLKTQTATFFKPEHPLRSAFRVEPLAP
ncbi:MAG TPA: hypothetical protein VFR04_02965 [Solirubrobacterales bacterium]|nr:hypothetical protein [Solirubrobacterales bacterium]